MDIKLIERWLTHSDGDGSGAGAGYGYGYGIGAGASAGDGSGYGYGHGYGYGVGYGHGHGNGDGDGIGYGYGYGASAGDGYKLNNNMVYSVDNIPSIITKIKNNIAKGYIVNKDLTLTETYIVKSDDSKYFAHGFTLKEAFESLQEKFIEELDEDERVELFLEDYNQNGIMKDGHYYFNWHGKLTGSCKQGRESFVKNNNIDLNKYMTIEEFIKLTLKTYGNDVIELLAKKLNIATTPLL